MYILPGTVYEVYLYFMKKKFQSCTKLFRDNRKVLGSLSWDSNSTGTKSVSELHKKNGDKEKVLGFFLVEIKLILPQVHIIQVHRNLLCKCWIFFFCTITVFFAF